MGSMSDIFIRGREKNSRVRRVCGCITLLGSAAVYFYSVRSVFASIGAAPARDVDYFVVRRQATRPA